MGNRTIVRSNFLVAIGQDSSTISRKKTNLPKRSDKRPKITAPRGRKRRVRVMDVVMVAVAAEERRNFSQVARWQQEIRKTHELRIEPQASRRIETRRRN